MVQKIDALVYDSYIKHIVNLIPREDVKINEQRIDVLITIFIPWPIFRHLCNAWRISWDEDCWYKNLFNVTAIIAFYLYWVRTNGTHSLKKGRGLIGYLNFAPNFKFLWVRIFLCIVFIIMQHSHLNVSKFLKQNVKGFEMGITLSNPILSIYSRIIQDGNKMKELS